ncbi:hypothetical protein F5Y19DRAFT_256828 [Xylariaceae sp. FL1651]|nr:hypothetical protein F5Y19DRAFT_256828 [Xylariaceae sp. FL1651]
MATDNMGPILFQDDDRDHYVLPSTFSPWRSNGHIDSADSNSTRMVGVNTTSPKAELAISPSSVQSLPLSDFSNSSFARRASSAIYSPQSLHAASPTIPHSPNPRVFTTPPQVVMSSAASEISACTMETPNSQRPSEAIRQTIFHEELSSSSLAPSMEQSTPAVSSVNAIRSADIMPTHPGADSVPMTAMYNPEPSPNDMGSEDEGETYDLSPRYTQQPPVGCHSRRDVHIKRWSWLYITLALLSVYSTGFSGLWVVVSFYQPVYGRSISSGSGWQIAPSTATLLATLAAKTIELSFVTVFVAVLGQVLTRRAFSRTSRGVTLAEMTMRNWVIQPGSLLTHWEGFPYAGTTVLGALTLTATICALLYTTASDAMVSPKLKRQEWVIRDLHGRVNASYANPYYVKPTCQTPLARVDPDNAPSACLDVLFSGQSYHSLIAFMKEWDDISISESSTMNQITQRPTGKHNLFDNTTMDSSWIETEFGDTAANFDTHKRIINNVTLAMPHAGVYAAATDPVNGILQPNDLLGVGEYSIRAGVVSPAVNVMCVNMNADELAPLVYTRWPDAKPGVTEVPPDFADSFPGTNTEWLNSTVVDNIFLWGERYGRRPPVFPLYPIEYNMITYASDNFTDSLYILAKAASISDYTLCEMRSWLTPKCSTVFNVSGTSGGHMKAHCEDPDDVNAYERVDPQGATQTQPPSGDWKNVAVQWALSIDLNGGVQNSNASNARVLTSLVLAKPELNPQLPSIAEAIAVLASSTLVASSLDSTFKSTWVHGNALILNPGVYENFHAEVQTQQYASAHTASWQAIFYPVLVLVFVLNVLCLVYLIFGAALTSSSKSKCKPSSKSSSGSAFRFPFQVPFSPKTHSSIKEESSSPNDESDNDRDIDPSDVNDNGNGNARRSKVANGLVTDYTEPQNLFALAINSPPSCALAGSCGHGPDAAEFVVPWRVGYAAGANQYFFEEGLHASDSAAKKEDKGRSSGANLLSPDMAGGSDGDDGMFGKSYKRLSSRRMWL